jgi:hemerythrin superfamily protein
LHIVVSRHPSFADQPRSLVFYERTCGFYSVVHLDTQKLHDVLDYTHPIHTSYDLRKIEFLEEEIQNKPPTASGTHAHL